MNRIGQKLYESAAVAFLVLGLAACGGGGSSGNGGGSSSGGSSSSSSSGGGAAPPSYEFTSAEVGPGGDLANPKMLKFSWSTESTPDSFRLDVNPDGASGYSSVLENIPGSSTSVDLELASLHFTQWASARYQLVAVKDGEDTASSNELAIAGIENARMVGYFKSTSPHENEWFGREVALSGDGETLVVGTPYKNFEDSEGNTVARAGAAYVFKKGSDGWKLQQEIWADVPVESGGFGRAVAISADGNVIAVGSPFESYSGDAQIEDYAGSVYLFVRTEAGWEQDGKFVSTPAANAQLGATVALSADGTLLSAGAPFSPLGDGQEGGFVAIYDVGNGVELSRISAGDTEQRDRFGESLAMSADGKLIVVGAPEAGVDVDIWRSGAAYIFSRDGLSNSWNLMKKYSAASSGESFGHQISLSADGKTLAVGAVNAAVDEADNRGGATFVYRAGIDVNGNVEWPDSSSTVHYVPDHKHSRALAFSADGNVLAVGVQLANGDGKGVGAEHNAGALSSGSVYIYRNGENAIYVKAPNTEENDMFGWGLALSEDGKTLAVSAIGESSCGSGVGGQDMQDNNDCPSASAVYLY